MHETVKEDLLEEDSLLATSVWSAMLAGNRKFAEGSLNCDGLSEETRLSLVEVSILELLFFPVLTRALLQNLCSVPV